MHCTESRVGLLLQQWFSSGSITATFRVQRIYADVFWQSAVHFISSGAGSAAIRPNAVSVD